MFRSFFSQMFLIFSLCRHSATNMPLGFVDLQNGFHLMVEFWVYIFQPLTDIFMYRRFADSKLFGGFSYRSLAFNNIFAQFYCSCFYKLFHIKSLLSVVVQYICIGEGGYPTGNTK